MIKREIRSHLSTKSLIFYTAQNSHNHFLIHLLFFLGFPFSSHLGIDSHMMQNGLMGGSAAALGAGPTNNNSPSVNPDPNVKVNLENDELWKSFHKIGTEMIITKMGR